MSNENPALFEQLQLRQLALPNRIIIAPMCQYSADEGKTTDWHLIHMGHLAQSGCGMLILEATAVEPRGRITHGCLGLYDDETENALSRVVEACKKYGNTPIGIQLGHAGRKASAHPPQNGGAPLKLDEDSWETIAPSDIPFANDWHRPRQMDRSLMKHVIEAHVQAVHRCERIGFDAVELHGAHGYLVSSFLSPIANQRTDEYGGPMQNRMRFPLELFAAMREAWPATKPMGVRFNGTDWDDKGLLLEEAIEFGQALKKLGCDFFDISGGGNNLSRPEVKPAYQVQFATAIKRATGIPTMAVGMIRDPHLAETLISEEACDMIAIARGFLFEPRWSWKAAYELGATCDYPTQYARANPLLWPQAFPDNQKLNDTALDWEVGAAPHIMVPKN